MRKTMENTEHLTIRQAEVSELIVEDGQIKGVKDLLRGHISRESSCTVLQEPICVQDVSTGT